MTWQAWLVLIPFVGMVVAAIALDLCRKHPKKCFRSNPDALDQCFKDCERCDDREECL